MPCPPFSEAMVLSADPKTHGLRVVLSTGQAPAYPVKVLTHGPSDGVTTSHKPLPRPGSWGLVAFPGGDNRSGVWLGSTYLSGQDAYTSETDEHVDLDSHWSGNFELTDGSGKYTHSFSDGSFIQVSDTTTKPQLSRHVINADQSRSLVAFTDAARIPNPPAARHIVINHASGATVHIDPTGNVMITSAGTNEAAISMTAAGVVTVDAASLVSLGGFGATVYRLIDERFKALYDSHTHTVGVNTSSGPNNPITLGSQSTTITKAS